MSIRMNAVASAAQMPRVQMQTQALEFRLENTELSPAQYVQVVVQHPCRTMMDINARVSGIKQHCLIGSELPQSLMELDRIHCNRSIPPRHYTRIACGLSSSTSSTNQADNIRPAMIVHEREENIRIKISHPHARLRVQVRPSKCCRPSRPTRRR